MAEIVDRLFDRGVRPTDPCIGVDVAPGAVTVTVGGLEGATALTFPPAVALRLALAWGDGARRALEAQEARAAAAQAQAPVRTAETPKRRSAPKPPPAVAAAAATPTPAKAKPKARPKGKSAPANPS